MRQAVRESIHPKTNLAHSSKVRGADDRFGVPAYEGVGLSRLAARAGLPTRVGPAASLSKDKTWIPRSLELARE
jgi:hypothetical protein